MLPKPMAFGQFFCFTPVTPSKHFKTKDKIRIKTVFSKAYGPQREKSDSCHDVK